MCFLLTIVRATTTCKIAAFGAPRWAYSDTFWSGDMALSDMEIQLCEAYHRHGRADLAECVKSARVHQHLDGFFGTDLFSSFGYVEDLRESLHALQSTLDPNCDHEMWKSVREWQHSTEKKYQGDDGLELAKRLDRQHRETRTRSEFVYPLKRTMGLIRKGLRKMMGADAV
jgi:hypothetical protein